MKSTYLVIAILLCVIGFGVVFVINNYAREGVTQEITSFDECVNAGYPVLESYPEQCKTPLGKTFVRDIGNEFEKQDLIRVSAPRPNTVIQSPLTIIGEARGTWYFEASFPVRLLDGDGNEIPITPGYIMTSNEWMTEDFVQFEGKIAFDLPATAAGTLILKKDNPSGLPEHDDELRIPVRFEVTND